MAEVKWSKECKDCGRRYPTACGIGTCLECKSELERTQKPPTVEEEEFNHLSYVYGRVQPSPLSTEDQEKCDAEWAALEAESNRRGERWTVADLISEKYGLAA